MVRLVNPEPWAPAIGRLFIAFGSIERTTHDCIQEWAGRLIHRHFAKARLEHRMRLAIDLANSRNASDQTKQAFIAAIDKAKALARYRNLVAHNPLCLVIFQEERESPFIEAIAAAVSDTHISLSELNEKVASAEACSEELRSAFIAFRVEAMNFNEIALQASTSAK